MDRPRTSAPVAALWAVAVALCLAGGAFGIVDGDAAAAVAAVVSAVLPTVGAVVARHVPRNPVGWSLLGGGVLGATGTLGLLAGPVSLTHHWPAGLTHTLAWLNAWTWVPGLASALVFTALWFPDGRLAHRALRPVLVGGLAAVGVWAVTIGSAAWMTSTSELVHDAAPPPTGERHVLWTIGESAAAVLLITALIAAASLVLRWRRGTALQRVQLKWLSSSLLGVAAFLALSILVDLGSWQNTLGAASLDLVAVAMGVAVLRYRLYDIDRILSRTVTYSIVTALLAAVYVGTVAGLSASLPQRLNSLAVAAATLAVAGLFVPLRRAAQRRVDARFNRQRYDRSLLVDRFAEQLRRDPTHGRDGADLLAVVTAVLAPAQAAIWLMPQDTATPASSAALRWQ